MNSKRHHSWRTLVTTVLATGALTMCMGGAALAATGFSARALATQAESALAAGHPGQARLDWERARLLAPRSPAVAAGLEKARAAGGVIEQPPVAWRRLASHLTSNEWAWIGVGGLACAAAALMAFGWGLARTARWAGLAGGGVVAALGLAMAIATAPPPDRAVVVTPASMARIAPFAQADAAFPVAEGAVVSVGRQHGDYTLITGPAGEGWVPSSAVETVVPHSGASPARAL